MIAPADSMDFGQNPYSHHSAIKTEYWGGCDECVAEAQERQTLGGVSVYHLDLYHFPCIVRIGGVEIPVTYWAERKQ